MAAAGLGVDRVLGFAVVGAHSEAGVQGVLLVFGGAPGAGYTSQRRVDAVGAAGHVRKLFLELQELVVFGLDLQFVFQFQLSVLVAQVVQVGDKLRIFLQSSNDLFFTAFDSPIITLPNLMQALL